MSDTDFCEIKDINTYLKENFATDISAYGADEEQIL